MITSISMHVGSSTEEREAFDSLKVAANATNTKYYIGTDFTTVYDLLPGETVDVSFDTYVEIDGADPLIIYQGTKQPRGFREGLQSALTSAQMAAVNSGVTAEKVAEHDAKQTALSNAQLAAVNSGITATKRIQYDNYDNYKQDTLSVAQMAAVDSGITAGILNELIAETFPLVAEYGAKNNGTYEYGTTITPSVAWTATRKGSNVTPSQVDVTSTIHSGTLANDKLSYSGDAVQLTSEVSFSAEVTQGGQTQMLSEISWKPSYYRYKIDLGTTKPTTTQEILNIIANAMVTNDDLSTTSTLGNTTMLAGHYYLFAVKGSKTLKAYDSNIGGDVNCTTGTINVPLRNGYKENGSNAVKTFLYSYIIVDKGATTWTFNIKNS